MSGAGDPSPVQGVFGRMPLLLAEREYGTAGAHATCFAYGVATWCFLTGGYVAELVGAVEGLVCHLKLSVTTWYAIHGCE